MGRIIGITGGIGCGKSTVCNLLKERYGAIHYNADIRVKELYVSNRNLFSLIKESFPEAIEYNQIIFQKLGNIIFSDKERLHKLNNLVSSFIIADFKDWAFHNSDFKDLILLESAILIDSELIKSCNSVIYVYAPENIRKERVSERDIRSFEQLEQIFKIQSGVEDFVKKSNIIINNSYNTQHLSEEVDKAYSFLKKKL